MVKPHIRKISKYCMCISIVGLMKNIKAGITFFCVKTYVDLKPTWSKIIMIFILFYGSLVNRNEIRFFFKFYFLLSSSDELFIHVMCFRSATVCINLLCYLFKSHLLVKSGVKKIQNCKMYDASIINDLIGTMRKILLCYLFFIDVMNMLLLN